MTLETITALVRHLLTFGGGFLVSSNTFDSATLDTGVGAILTLFGIAWSIWHKKSSAPADKAE